MAVRNPIAIVTIRTSLGDGITIAGERDGAREAAVAARRCPPGFGCMSLIAAPFSTLELVEAALL
jgi:hypothetical protein